MPLKHLPECLLGVPLDDLAMAGDQRGKVPLVNHPDAVIQTVAVLGNKIPVEALHPRRVAGGALRTLEQLVGKTTWSVAPGRPAVLLNGRQVEHEIGLDENLVRPVVEDEFLVGVAVDVLVVKVCVELVADPDAALAVPFEDDGELVIVDFRIVQLLGALLEKALGRDEFRAGILLGPFRDEDVVLQVKGNDVGYAAAQFGDLGFRLVREGDGREDGEVARSEFD